MFTVYASHLNVTKSFLANHADLVRHMIFVFTVLQRRCTSRLQWLSGRVLDSRGRGFKPHQRHCVVSLSKDIIPSLVLVQPRKTRPFITEISSMGPGAQWLSGRVLDSRPRVPWFELHQRHCVVSLSKDIIPSLVLVQPRKTRPFITEISSMGPGVQWFSGRVLDSRPRGRGFEPHQRHCVVSLSKGIIPSLVLGQPRKTRPFITEISLLGRKETNQTNKQNIQIALKLFLCTQVPRS